ncbi:dienelactone hydrolase family protein (plasmid) [Nitrobacteraceae bacterium UC4446_H13]
MSLIVSNIPYTIDGTPYEGCWIHSSGAGARPAVLMATDWMGIGAGAIAMAKEIAGTDFSVFVADMYGVSKRPRTVEDAIAFSDPLKKDLAQVRIRITGAFATMIREPASGVRRTGPYGAVGFCFGGMNVLELARTGADLKLSVSIHGDLVTTMPADQGAIKGELMVLHGAADPVSPKLQRDAFEAEMEAAGAKWSMTTFGHAMHSFTDRTAAVPGVAEYDAFAANWSMALLDRALRQALL